MKTPRHSFDLEMKMKPETILVAICQRQDIRIKKKKLYKRVVSKPT